MDIRSSLDGLKSILGVAQPDTTAAQPKSNAATSTIPAAWSSDQTTLSSVGSAVSSSSFDSGVRTDKVAAIQAALASGTYQVSASAVASSLVSSMMSASR
jgi:negative regulator of flagellin synthesis FlgM